MKHDPIVHVITFRSEEREQSDPTLIQTGSIIEHTFCIAPDAPHDLITEEFENFLRAMGYIIPYEE